MVLTLNLVLICVTILSIVVAVSTTLIGSWSVNRFSGLSHNTFTLPDDDLKKETFVILFNQILHSYLPVLLLLPLQPQLCMSTAHRQR